MNKSLNEFVYEKLGELEKLFQKKHEQYSSCSDELANFRRGALLNGHCDDAEGMFEELKAYMAKHIAFVYTHDIHGDKIAESLKDIAVYSLIGLYMAELAKAEDEETYSLGLRHLDDALILATAESYHRGYELGNVIKPVFTARESKEDTEK
ncbi:hypothetical protein [Phascolarctobacterium succinatutens]|uniref:hypothetical protein n=1 Tax=Phascolarctobacterium succinatutens TaxID=626940 RepID=UPI003FD6FF2E